MKPGPAAAVLLCLACVHSSQYPISVSGLGDDEIARCQTAPLLAETPPIASYWQPGTFPDSPDEIVRNWYSAQLCAMGEPPLKKLTSEEGMRIRFLWLRSFDPAIAVRVESDGRTARLVAVEMTPPDDSDTPGRISRRISRELFGAEWKALKSEVSKSRFWTSQSEKHGCCDGARWVFEVIAGERYHVVDRWGGDHLEDLGRELVQLSGIDPGEFY